VILDPMVPVVRFQKRAQGRAYSSIPPGRRRDHRARPLPDSSLAHAPRKCAAVVRKDHAQIL